MDPAGLGPRGLFQEGRQRVDARGRPGAHVEGSRVYACAVLKRHVGGDQVGGRHVFHVDVVSRLLAVAVDGQGFARDQTVGEDGHHARLAFGILPGAVDVAVS